MPRQPPHTMRGVRSNHLYIWFRARGRGTIAMGSQCRPPARHPMCRVTTGPGRGSLAVALRPSRCGLAQPERGGRHDPRISELYK